MSKPSREEDIRQAREHDVCASIAAIESAAYLIEVVASPGEESRAPRPFLPIGRTRLSKSAFQRTPGAIPPGWVVVVQAG